MKIKGSMHVAESSFPSGKWYFGASPRAAVIHVNVSLSFYIILPVQLAHKKNKKKGKMV